MLTIVIVIQSCDQPSSKEIQNKASVAKANDELFVKGNLDFADEAFTADYAGRGPSLAKEYVSSRRIAFPDLQVKVDPMIAEGDMVAWLRTSTGTQTGEYLGYQPTDKKITWKEMVFSRYTEDGKIAEEWGVSDVDDMLQSANEVDGIYKYLPPLKGQCAIRNGHFVYLLGPSDGSGPMFSQAGTHTFSGDTVKNTITYCTNPKQIGMRYWWRVKSWSGDTVTWETMNEQGQITGGGRGVRVSK